MVRRRRRGREGTETGEGRRGRGRGTDANPFSRAYLTLGAFLSLFVAEATALQVLDAVVAAAPDEWDLQPYDPTEPLGAGRNYLSVNGRARYTFPLRHIFDLETALISARRNRAKLARDEEVMGIMSISVVCVDAQLDVVTYADRPLRVVRVQQIPPDAASMSWAQLLREGVVDFLCQQQQRYFHVQPRDASFEPVELGSSDPEMNERFRRLQFLHQAAEMDSQDLRRGERMARVSRHAHASRAHFTLRQMASSSGGGYYEDSGPSPSLLQSYTRLSCFMCARVRVCAFVSARVRGRLCVRPWCWVYTMEVKGSSNR